MSLAAMVVIAKYEPLLRQLGLATLPQVKAFRGEVIKNQRGRRDILRIVAREGENAARILFLKRSWKPYLKDGLVSLLRRGQVWSISRQEWENACELQRAGLGVAGLIAYGQDCGPLREKFSFIITESAPGRTIEEFLRGQRDGVSRRRVFDALARAIRRLHDAGLATPDLFTRHIFVDSESTQPGFTFIDMARLDRARPLPDSKRARDLAALNITAPLRWVSRRERVRFLQVYAGKLDRRLVGLIEKRVWYLLKQRRFQGFRKNNDPKVK